ncbi:AEC family transporter [Noviherbaspirillum sp. CPCC 100848]|uniref:AEC family transporter n=1 Tax=Noviherbaspirillum album TaxID=3080276 RepID=A0ABU6JA36_9BURK|nr:AEC family transporter [Noviherbaspirillum sp. CPCC 100848]MEC4720175.1 AEC family transporter [Noviherbaspirillum sp. CPCC 100848]
MSIVTILFPDFALILLGFLLMRYTDWGKPFWSGLEKMIYYFLFPALLFYSTARTPFDFATTGTMLKVALLTITAGIALGWIAKPLFNVPPMMFESGVQTAFRFNSYIALAVASRLGGEQGTSMMALIIGFGVPLCNMAAVHALVKKGGGLLREMAKNPLLVATACGMACNLAGLQIPEVIGATLSRMSNASIALGLIAVGAGLRLSGVNEAKGMALYFTAVKLLALPAVALLLGRWLQLPPLQLQLVVVFAALPTASSAYVLAARMGGNGPFVAFLISGGTVLSALTLPLWLGLAR